MIRWLTLADIQDLYLQARWSAFRTVFRTLRLTGKGRTLSRWNNHVNMPINWYDLPYVVKYVQRNISGEGDKPYARYVMEKYFPRGEGIRILSPGCGIGVKEFQFAALPSVGRIDGFDISEVRVAEARRRAASLGLDKARFSVGNIYDLRVEEPYDMVLFDGCLHHFDGLDALLDKVKACLKPGGLVVIVEFTGPTRYQFTPAHVAKCNEALGLIPRSHRTFLRTSWAKTRIWAPGWIRMYLSDPSEGVRSGDILPTLRRKFLVLEEKKVGGDLLAPVLKGTVHHYMQDNRSNPILDRLFAFERGYLEGVPSANYTFGVYASGSPGAAAPEAVPAGSAAAAA